MKDIDDHFLEEEDSEEERFQETVTGSGLRRKLKPKSPFLAWAMIQSGRKQGGDLSEKLKEPKIDAKLDEAISQLIHQYGPKRTYEALQYLVDKEELSDLENPVFEQLQGYLRKKGITLVLLPYVSREGHA